MGEYVPEQVPGLQLREDLQPLEITQPDGVSFTLDGNVLAWQRWSMRVGFNYREGLVLHKVGYDDDGRPGRSRTGCRSRRWSCRTATRRVDHYRRTAYDIGEWGLGFMTTSLELGCDCLGEIRYLDAQLHDSRGRAVHDQERRLHPRGGQRGPVEARRRRRRCARCAGCGASSCPCHATVANYEYLIYWRFYQDGNIECEIRATGIMVTTPFPEGQKPPVRHAGRRAHVRAVPPALPRRPPGPGRRRPEQHGRT